MRKAKGTRYGLPILVLFLAFLLICSPYAMAQWSGANNTLTTIDSTGKVLTRSDQTSALTVTAVTTPADGSSATLTINPMVNNNGGVAFKAGQTAALPACVAHGNPGGLKISGTLDPTLCNNVLVQSATATSVTVLPQAGKFFTANLTNATVTSGTLAPVAADPNTGLPGMTYGGDQGCLACHHGMPTNPFAPNEEFAYTGPQGTVPDCTTLGVNNSQCGPMDANGYLLTGHKNMLRKVLPPQTVLPAGPYVYADPLGMLGSDGNVMPSTDSSGNTYDWTTGLVTVGGVQKPLLYTFAWDTGVLNGIWMGGGDYHGNYQCARCHTTGYSFDGTGPEPTVAANGSYTLLTDAQFSRYPATGAAGNTASWMLTGIQCERCHNNTNNGGSSGSTDCASAGLTWPTIAGQAVSTCFSWTDGSGTPHVAKPYQPVNVQATALCIECHRQEITVSKGKDPVTGLPNGMIQPAQLPGHENDLSGLNANAVNLGGYTDGGKCSDGSSKLYSVCIAAGLSWNFAPSMSHGATGAQAFLNSPHALYNGTLQLNQQNSVDLSVQLNGTFNSYFTDWGEGLGEGAVCIQGSGWTATVVPGVHTQSACSALGNGYTWGFQEGLNNNAGCTGCHNPHYSVVATNVSPAPTPIIKQCQDCHKGNYAITAVNHPTGKGTPLGANGLSASDSTPCVICHTAAAGSTLNANGEPMGTAKYHYFRINPDPSYYTFGPASKYYAAGDTPVAGVVGAGQTAKYQQPNVYYTSEAGPSYAAVGLDVDIACGQCHGGGNTGINTYGMTPASVGAKPISRSQLAAYAANMHSGSVAGGQTPSPTAATPQFSWASGTYPMGTLNVTLSDATPGAVIMYGTAPGGPWTAGATLPPITQNATYYAYAQGFTVPAYTDANGVAHAAVTYADSPVTSATYFIQLNPPTFSANGAYSSQTTVTLAADPSYPTASLTYATVALNAACTPSTAYVSGTTNIVVTTGGTICAQASAVGYVSSVINETSVSVTPAKPLFDKSSGSYLGSVTVNITGPAGSTIYYTTNGYTPTTASTACGTNPCAVPVLGSETLKAIAAYSVSGPVSGVTGASYSIVPVPAPPTFSVKAGTYKGAQTVTILAMSGASIYTTLDGSTPTTASNLCGVTSCTIQVSSSGTLEAIAVNAAGSSSAASATYTIQ